MGTILVSKRLRVQRQIRENAHVTRRYKTSRLTFNVRFRPLWDDSRSAVFSVSRDFLTLRANLGVSTRDRGTITKLDAHGNVQVDLDSGRNVRWNLSEHRHIDYAYAMTSYSSQGTTIDRVLLHIDTSDYRLSGLLNKTLAYVGASRAQYDIRIFTDDAARLERSLSRENERAKALSPEQIREYRPEVRSIAYV